LSDIGAQTVTAEELVKVSQAISDNSYGVGAFIFGSGTELVTMKQVSYVGAKF